MDWPLLTVLIISALCSSEARGVIVPDFNLIKALAAKMKLYQVISLLKMLLQVHLYTVMILCSCSLCNIYLSKFSYLNHLNQSLIIKIRRADIIISVSKGGKLRLQGEV